MLSEKVAELEWRKYSAGDPSADSGMELEDFENAVQAAYAFLIKKDYWDTFRKTGEKTVNQAWLVSYPTVAVSYDSVNDTYYSVLPEQVFDLPQNGAIVITSSKNFQNQFKPQTISESSFFEGTPTDYVTYHRDKTKIYYDNFDSNIQSVFMQFPPLVAEDIPDEFLEEVRQLVRTDMFPVLNLKEDKLTDNNPNRKDISTQQ